MATKIETFDFSSKRKYDWTNWLDGSIWVLSQGEDFETETSTMRSVAIMAGRSRGLKVRTSVDAKAKTVTIQSYKE